MWVLACRLVPWHPYVEFCIRVNDVVRLGVEPWRGCILPLRFWWALSGRGSGFAPSFSQLCVHFDFAHLVVNMTQRLTWFYLKCLEFRFQMKHWLQLLRGLMGPHLRQRRPTTTGRYLKSCFLVVVTWYLTTGCQSGSMPLIHHRESCHTMYKWPD